MKKGRLKKIIASSAMGIMALTMPFALTGCDEDSDINVRVNGDYVQWQVDGSDSWTNLLTLDEVKDILGEEYKGDTGAQGEKGDKGDPGTNGINGKEVEFRSTDTHIQWRYVDSNQEADENWVNLIAFEDLKEKEPVVDQEALNQRGFALFQSNLNNMNSNYKVSYEYADDYIVESCLNYSVLIDESSWYTNTLNMRISMQYAYNTTASTSDENIEEFRPYSLNIIGESTQDKKANHAFFGMCKYINDIKEYKLVLTGGSVNYLPDSYMKDEDFDYNFVAKLKTFKYENVLDCKFNDSGSCILSLNYSGNYSSYYPYLNENYIYDFYIDSDGVISKCYVYEKDFLNNEEKGDVYCKISYEKNKSLIDSDLIDAAFDMYKEYLEEKYPEEALECNDWYDVFKYEDQN